MKNTNQITRSTLKILLSFLLIVGLALPYGGWGVEKVEAASNILSKTYNMVEGTTSTQNLQLDLPSDFNQLVSVTLTSGQALNPVIDSANKKLKVTVTGTNQRRNETIYSGLREGSAYSSCHSPAIYCSGGFHGWYEGNGLYNVQVNYGDKYNEAGWWSASWSSDYNSYGAYASPKYPGDPAEVFYFRGYTSQTVNTYYQYTVTLNYTTNSDPLLTLALNGNQTLSEVDGYNQLPISGTVQDLDIGDILNVKYTIDGTTHIARSVSSLTANGSNQTFNKNIPIDSTIPEGNRTMRIWAEDNKGGKSAERTITLNIDKTAPLISFGNINEGETKFGEFTPQITVTDSNAPTHTMKLNGNAYNGMPITNSGDYTLDVTATDSVGNTSNKAIDFTLNQKPYSLKTIDNQSLNKFDEIIFAISDYYADVENDPLEVLLTNSDPSIVSAIVDNDELVVKALKQGTSTVTVKVNDGHSDSDTLTFNVDVETRSPEITINNDSWILADDSTDIELSGTITDEDLEQVTVSGTLNNLLKQFIVPVTSGNKDAWSITWKGSDLALGVYPSVLITAEDDFSGKTEKTFEKSIVKVSGNKESYMLIVDSYAIDLGKDPNDWNTDDHIKLVDSYEAMKKLGETNSVTNQIDASEKVELLSSGQLKTIYLEEIEKLALEWLMVNLDKATATDYERAGFTDVQANRLPDYEQAFNEYESSISPLTPKDMQQVIDTINAVIHARENPSTESIKDAYDAVNGLEDGQLKDRLLQELEDIAVEYVANNPQLVTVKDLAHANINDVDSTVSYAVYLQDVLTGIANVTKEDIQNVINTVNAVMDAYDTVIANPTRSNLEEFITLVGDLEAGDYKIAIGEEIPKVTISHMVFAPDEQDTETYTWSEVTFNHVNIDAYNQHLPQYVKDIQPLQITQIDIQTFIDAVDAFEVAYSTPIAVYVSTAINSIKNMKNGITKELLMNDLSEKVLASINDDLENTTVEDLENVGITDLEKIHEKEYQDAFTDYKNQIGKDLTLEDIQKIVDAINRIHKAENDLTSQSLQDALDAISKLEDGPLKDSLIERLIEAAVLYVNQNPSTVTVQDLEIAGINDVNSELINEYQTYLPDYQPLTQAKIQQVIDAINLLNLALLDFTVNDVQTFEVAVQSLETSVLKTNLTTVSEALTALVAYEANPSDETFTDFEVVLSAVLTHDKAYLQSMADSLEISFATALVPTDEAVEEAIVTIGQLRDGQFKTRLLTKVGEAFLEFVQNNPDTFTAEDLLKAGFERVNEDAIEDYRKAIVSLTEEVGTVDRQTIQLVIDIVNGFRNHENNLTKAQQLKEEIEKLVSSQWKSEQLDEINTLIVQLTPTPSSPSEGGGTTNTGVIQPKPEEPKKPDTDSIIVEGKNTTNGYEFVVGSDLVDKAIDGKQSIVMKQAGNVEITIPIGSIDFAALQKQLGKYGLLIQLIKIDDTNYRLSVKATTPEGEKEIVNFEKHVSVAMKESKETGQIKAAFSSIAMNGSFQKGSFSKQSIVLRKEGDSLIAVPHTFNGNAFTIKTTRAGHFIVVDEHETVFKDISNYANRDDIVELANRKIVFGTTPETYAPSNEITRAQLAVMIARAMDLHSTNETVFTDVKGKWYEREVQALFEAGIIKGTSATTFNPANIVNRQQAAQMMARALRYADANLPEEVPNLSYTDSDSIGAMAKHDVQILHDLNIMTGKQDNRFDPSGSLTRAQMAKILYHTLKEIGFM